VARLQAKSLENPDEVRPTPFGHIDIYNLDDLVIGRMVFEPGWHWMEHVQPIAGTSLCQYHHVGVCIAGRLANRLEDGTTIEVGPPRAATDATCRLCRRRGPRPPGPVRPRVPRYGPKHDPRQA
jgi:hypothetical protein